ncbi:Hypothetical predicted protein [Mytilus galloprovincialis]|uniref:Uncharacterized protein n=1 Tax=Mytilus galloprovincialis TaxID=29158 RepID=A0A8B6BRG3_MYTGA|nr:Hypothetical predicted protein [Mytilus galloprovincialis]
MVQRELRRAYWKYIENIVTPKKENTQYSNMKQLCTYIKHKRTESSGVAPLRSEGLLQSHPVEQSNILNKQFQSAFSTKDTFNQHEFSSRCQMSGKYRRGNYLKEMIVDAQDPLDRELASDYVQNVTLALKHLYPVENIENINQNDKQLKKTTAIIYSNNTKQTPRKRQLSDDSELKI